MALLLGDIHGNLDKARKFIAYKPEETHVFVGDYVDSFDEPDSFLYSTLKECIESDAILLWGNHDLHYLSEPPFMCSGFRHHMKNSLNQIFEEFIDRFKPATVCDGFLVTHGGVTGGLGNSLLKTKDVNVALKKIEDAWAEYLHVRFKRKPNMPRMPNKLFNISPTRGGRDSFSGIFWADYRSDELYGLPQIFGHSRTKLDDIINVGKKHAFWALGCDNNRRICFNSKTQEVEDFG